MLGLAQDLADHLHALVRDRIMRQIVLGKFLILGHCKLHSVKNFFTVIELTVRQTNILQTLSGRQTLEYQNCSFVHQWVPLQVYFEHLRVLEDQDFKEPLSTVWPDITVREREQLDILVPSKAFS